MNQRGKEECGRATEPKAVFSTKCTRDSLLIKLIRTQEKGWNTVKYRVKKEKDMDLTGIKNNLKLLQTVTCLYI